MFSKGCSATLHVAFVRLETETDDSITGYKDKSQESFPRIPELKRPAFGCG